MDYSNRLIAGIEVSYCHHFFFYRHNDNVCTECNGDFGKCSQSEIVSA